MMHQEFEKRMGKKKRQRKRRVQKVNLLFHQKNTNDVTRRVPQPTDTGYKLFLARRNLSAVDTRARPLLKQPWRRRREHAMQNRDRVTTAAKEGNREGGSKDDNTSRKFTDTTLARN